MTFKITFSKRDEILGAIIRALAVQVAGFQVVGGMNATYLRANGFYRFKFSQPQFERFRGLVKEYIPDQLQELIQMEEDSN